MPTLKVHNCTDAAAQVFGGHGTLDVHLPAQLSESLHGFGSQDHAHDFNGIVPFRFQMVLDVVAQLVVLEKKSFCGTGHVDRIKVVGAQGIV